MQKQYFYIALVVGICLEYAGSDDTTKQETQDATINSSSQGSENTEEENVTDHTFVALIDIVYTDGSKRSCTGAIIDDNVVVTAAHCFVVKNDPEVQPELTASFVVIGTKKMFDTGYEQYLPIERVLTHPKYHEWTADISLVYTFAAMTADKPGTVIALAGDKTSHVENNVTVFSWGRYGDVDTLSTKSSLPKQQTKNAESCEDTSGFIRDEASNEYQITSLPKHDSDNRDYGDARSYDRIEKTGQGSAEVRMRHNVKKIKITKTTHSGVKQKIMEKPKKVVSRYLASDDELNPNAPGNYDEEIPEFRTRPERKEPLPIPIARESLDSYLESIWNKFISTQITQETTTQAVIETSNTGLKSHYNNWRRRMPTQTHKVTETTQVDIETSDTNLKSHYRNWRRQMPTQQNSLVVEVFGFITNQVCKKLIERGMSSSYDDISQQKDFVCYVSEKYPVTDRDSGAPAILHGQLIAVTLGGLQCNGDHVGFGMKIICFCSWIAENVPNGKNMTCCKNCCGNKREKRINAEIESPIRNKYLLR